MKILLIVLLTIFVILIIAVSFDAVPFIKNVLGRRGIGCYSDDEWAFNAEKKAVRWLETGVPVVPVIADKRFTVIDRIKGTYKADSISYWQKSALLAAINKTNSELAADIIYDEIEKNTLIE